MFLDETLKRIFIPQWGLSFFLVQLSNHKIPQCYFRRGPPRSPATPATPLPPPLLPPFPPPPLLGEGGRTRGVVPHGRLACGPAPRFMTRWPGGVAGDVHRRPSTSVPLQGRGGVIARWALAAVLGRSRSQDGARLPLPRPHSWRWCCAGWAQGGIPRVPNCAAAWRAERPRVPPPWDFRTRVICFFLLPRNPPHPLADPPARGPEPWQRGPRGSEAAAAAGTTAARTAESRARGVEKPVGCLTGSQALACWGPGRGTPLPPDQNSANLRARGALEKVRLGHWTLACLALPLSGWTPGCLLADVLCAGLPVASCLPVPDCLLPACRRLVCLTACCLAPASRPLPAAIPALAVLCRPAHGGLTCLTHPPWGGRQVTQRETPPSLSRHGFLSSWTPRFGATRTKRLGRTRPWVWDGPVPFDRHLCDARACL